VDEEKVIIFDPLGELQRLADELDETEVKTNAMQS
jgi:hypothetical protein